MLEDISTYYEHPIKEIVISQCGEYIFGDEIKMETESKIFLVNMIEISYISNYIYIVFFSNLNIFNYCFYFRNINHQQV